MNGIEEGHRVGRSDLDYDAVVTVERRPRRVSEDAVITRHGYAVEISSDQWFFFDSLLPALAFGRAARMSYQCTSYGVVKAAHRVEFDPERGVDVRTLYVIYQTLDRGPDEKQQLRRWADGVDPKSASWTGPES